jgi:mannose-6-phosphate isomerase-like protein (cupin superfamily)
MNLANLRQSAGSFTVLQTTPLSQTAVVALLPGESTSEKPNVHAKSDQVMLILEGELLAEIADEKRSVREGDSVIVPAGTPHKFTNAGSSPARAFSVYAPPAYPPSGE